MQSSSPLPAPTPIPQPDLARRAPRAARLLPLFLLLFFAAAGLASAQTLAHPGFVGNGLNTDPWWKQAVFYQIASPPPRAAELKAIIARLDSLHTLDIDAIILPMPRLPAQPQPSAKATTPPAVDPTLDAFDDLIRQASQRNLRILLSFTPSSLPLDLTGAARFWLSRGIAGFDLVPSPGADPQTTKSIIEDLRRLTAGTVGQRIVLSSFVPNAEATISTAPYRRSRRTSRTRTARTVDTSTAQLQIDSPLAHLDLPDAASLRALISQSFAQSDVVLDLRPPAPPAGSPDPYPALSRVMATVVLLTHHAALIDADAELPLTAEPTDAPATPPPAQPAPIVRPVAGRMMALPPAQPKPPSLADWYRRMNALHHGNPALRYGTATLLDFDAQNALVWVSRPADASYHNPPVVVACNLSSKPIDLALGASLRRLNLRGSFLETLVRTDKEMGPEDVDFVTLPPFGVYIGELKR